MTILAATLPQPHSRVAPKQATTNDRSPHSHSSRSHSPCLYLHLFFSLLISRCLFSFIVFLLFAWRGICLFVVAVVWGPGPNKQQRRRLPVCCLLSAWHFSRFANHPQKHALNSDIAQLRPLLRSFPASSTPAPLAGSACGWGAYLRRVHCAKLLCTWHNSRNPRGALNSPCDWCWFTATRPRSILAVFTFSSTCPSADNITWRRPLDAPYDDDDGDGSWQQTQQTTAAMPKVAFSTTNQGDWTSR